MSEGSRSYRTEALVIRHTNFGEADRILTLYSREKGKIRVVAKGVRKLKSRKAGHLEPFTRVQLQLAKGRDLPIVTQAETYRSLFKYPKFVGNNRPGGICPGDPGPIHF